MARFQTGIVWKDGAQHFFGIFQIHEAALCGNVGHTQYSFFQPFGLELEFEDVVQIRTHCQLSCHLRAAPDRGEYQLLRANSHLLLRQEISVLESYEGELKLRLRGVGSRRFQP